MKTIVSIIKRCVFKHTIMNSRYDFNINTLSVNNNFVKETIVKQSHEENGYNEHVKVNYLELKDNQLCTTFVYSTY